MTVADSELALLYHGESPVPGFLLSAVSHHALNHLSNQRCAKCLAELREVVSLRLGEHRCGLKKYGRDRTGAQRYRCRECKKITITATGDTPRQTPFALKMAAKRETYERLVLSGHSLRTAARLAGLSKDSVQQVKNAQCGCGRTTGHKDWCSWRFQQSEARQAVVGRWHGAASEVSNV